MIALLLAATLTMTQAPKPAINTKCPVLGGATNAKSPKVAVRGQEYYLCCSMCAPELTGNPDKFLNKDGTPKNK